MVACGPRLVTVGRIEPSITHRLSMPQHPAARIDDGTRVALAAHRGGGAKMLGCRPDRRCGTIAPPGQFACQFAALAQRGDVIGLAVVAVFDSRRHAGIGRDQRDAPPCPRLHQRHPDMRPVGMAGGTVTGHRHEATRVRPDLETVGRTEHDLQHGSARRHRPIGRQHPFGVVAEQHAHRQRLHHRHPHAGNIDSSPMPEAISRWDDSIAPAHNTTRSAVKVTAPCGPIASTPTTTVPEKRNRAARVCARKFRFGRHSAGNRYPAPEPLRTPSTMLSGTAPIPETCSGAIVEVSDPAETRAFGGSDETLGGPGHFVRSAHQDGTAVAMGGTIEIQVGLDGAEADQHVGPSPARDGDAIEVARQPAAEVAAVDRARTADCRPADQGKLAGGFVGEAGLITLDQRATDADRQLQPVGGLGQHPGSSSAGPASRTVTVQRGSAERRSATTDPALPAPTISTSLCGAAVVKAAVNSEFGVSGRARCAPVVHPTTTRAHTPSRRHV